MSRMVLEAIEVEYRRYRDMGAGGIKQLDDVQLCDRGDGANNSICMLVRHISGNFASRFTDFLTSDGEKPWRDRESEFDPTPLSKDEIEKRWDRGWGILFGALKGLTDADLGRHVSIRGQKLTVIEALQRSLAHVAYHVGQILYIGKSLAGENWKYLTIPPGQSASYNQNPTLERSAAKI